MMEDFIITEENLDSFIVKLSSMGDKERIETLLDIIDSRFSEAKTGLRNEHKISLLKNYKEDLVKVKKVNKNNFTFLKALDMGYHNFLATCIVVAEEKGLSLDNLDKDFFDKILNN